MFVQVSGVSLQTRSICKSSAMLLAIPWRCPPLAYLHGTTLQAQSVLDVSNSICRICSLPSASPLHDPATLAIDWLRGSRQCISLSGPFDFRFGLTSHAALGRTYIERLNSAVPDNICAQSGRRPADDHVIVYRDTLGPQHPALLGARLGVVFEGDGRGMAIVCGIRAHAAGMPLMALPVGRDYAVALWTSSGGFCPITSRRWSAVGGVSLNARRLHPFTVACWAGGASDRGRAGCYLTDNCAEVRGRWECV